MTKDGPSFIPSVFADRNNPNGKVPDTTHAGFILAEPNGDTIYGEYGPGGANSWSEVGGSTVFAGTKSSVRKLALGNYIKFDSKGNPTQASIEGALHRISATLHGGSDPGMIFATPQAISPAQSGRVEDYVTNAIKQIERGGDPYSLLLHNRRDFVHGGADASNIKVSASQHDLGVAWPALDPGFFLRESRIGFQYTAPGSWNGDSIREVSFKNYLTREYLKDRSIQRNDAFRNDEHYVSSHILKLRDEFSAAYFGIFRDLKGVISKKIGDAARDHATKISAAGLFDDLAAGVGGVGPGRAALRLQNDSAVSGSAGAASLLDDGAVLRALVRSPAFETPSAGFFGNADIEPPVFGSLDVRNSGNGARAPGIDRSSQGQAASEAVKKLWTDRGFNAPDTASRQHSEDRTVAAALFQNGFLQQKLAALGAIPRSSELATPVEPYRRNLGNVGLDGRFSPALASDGTSTQAKQHDDLAKALKRLGDAREMHRSADLETATSKGRYGQESTFPRGVGAIPGYNLHTAGGARVEAASGVAKALKNTTPQDDGGMPGGRVGSLRGLASDGGSSNGPLHDKVKNQAALYESHMPTGPTSSLPSQSLPIPGQVLFSP